jgi:hypothetical protein
LFRKQINGQNSIGPAEFKRKKNLAQSESETGAQRARVGVHIIRLLVSLRAVCVASSTGSGSAARVTGGSSEPRLDEIGAGVEIDRRHIPEQSISVLSVLELKNAGLILGGGHLDGDTAAVGVGIPVFAVVTTSGGESLHVATFGRGAPEVDVGVHVVDDLNTAAGATGLKARLSGANAVGVGESGSSGCEEAGKEDVESHNGNLFEKCRESGRQKFVCSTEILK